MDREKLDIDIVYDMVCKTVVDVENCVFADKSFNYVDDDWRWENFSRYIEIFSDKIFILLYGVNSDYISEAEEIKLRDNLKEEEIAFYYFNFWNFLEGMNPEMINADMWIELMGDNFNDINEYLYKYGVSEELRRTYEWNEDTLFDMDEETLKKFLGMYGQKAREEYIKEDIMNL